MTTYKYRPYVKGDEEVINNGFNEVFGRRRPLSEWHWKFRPEEDGCRIMVAVNEAGEIVAQYANVVVSVQVDGRIFRAGQGVDVYCLRDSEAIRQQVFLQTAEAFYRKYGSPDDLQFVYGFAGERSLRLHRLKLGYHDTLPVKFWRRRPADDRLWWPRFEVRQICTPEDLDLLWQVAGKRGLAGAVRNGEWLKHRFLSRPDQAYTQMTVWRRGAIHAWAVLDHTQDTVQWLDVLWNGEDPRALKELDHAVSVFAKSRDASAITMWLAGDDEMARQLPGLGWNLQKHPQDIHVIVRSLDPQIDASELAQRLHYTMSDSDLC